MIHPLLARAIVAPAIRARPMSLVILVALLDGILATGQQLVLVELFEGVDAPQLVKVGGMAHRLHTDRVTAARALAVLVEEGYLHLHGRTTRGIGLYTLGNGRARLACSLPAIVPRLEDAA